MKTKEEIKKWLNLQPWIANYIREFTRQHSGSTELMSFLSGEMLYATIIGAFNWDISEKGKQYWSDINDIFDQWFYGKIIKFKDLNINDFFLFNGRKYQKVSCNKCILINNSINFDVNEIVVKVPF